MEPPAPAVGPEWRPCVKLPITVYVRDQHHHETHLSTREGITPVRPDDLIMRGVQGEEYPIGRDLFNKTYRLGTADPTDSAPDPDPSDFQTFQGLALDMVESLRPIVIPEILGVLHKAIKSTGEPAPAGDGEREELAADLDECADSCVLAEKHNWAKHMRRAAALLREPALEGLFPVEYWHMDSGARIFNEPSEEQPSRGCWVVRNSRHVNPCTEFPTVAAALAALQPPQVEEVAK